MSDSKEPTAPAWMATFGDLMSLLLTFFVLLMSFASMDVRRFAAVVGSMRDAFGVQKMHPGPIEALSTSIVRLSDTESTPYMRVIDVPSRFVENDQSTVERLRAAVAETRLERVVQIEEDERGVVVRLPGNLLFEAGSSDLQPNALLYLGEIASLIRQMPGQVSVEGHTDGTPSVGGHATNWELSAARAVSALRQLIEVEDIDPKRLRATGRADTAPLVREAGPAERELNRRVDFVFEKPAAATGTLNTQRGG